MDSEDWSVARLSLLAGMIGVGVLTQRFLSSPRWASLTRYGFQWLR